MTQPTGKAPELDLELDSEIADGIYSNLRRGLFCVKMEHRSIRRCSGVPQ